MAPRQRRRTTTVRHRPFGVPAAATAAAVVLAVQGACPALAQAAPEPRRQPAVATAPGDHSVNGLLERLRTRYRLAQRAKGRYEATQHELTVQRTKVKKLDAQLAAATARVRGGREEAGRLARSQYRGMVPGMPPLLVLLLSGQPHAALAQDHALTHAVSTRTAAVKRLTTAEHRHDALARKARQALKRRQRLTDRREKQRDAMQRRLRDVEELLMQLPHASRQGVRPG
jgi:hypothetical protein